MKDFEVPKVLETKEFKIRPLRISDAKQDYKVVTANREFLKKVPLHEMWKDWPPKTLSMKKELRDLRWHELKHKNKEVFSYAILSPDESDYIGNIYIFPLGKGHSADIYFWITEKASEAGLNEKLYKKIKEWMILKWPFKNISFPGRDYKGKYN